MPSEEGIPRNVDWGVREHGMGAALNGMALHGGVIPSVRRFSSSATTCVHRFGSRR